ncbi:MAG: carboxypeptidase regulatory-like domain-containing protein [Catalinimonas sp.]
MTSLVLAAAPLVAQPRTVEGVVLDADSRAAVPYGVVGNRGFTNATVTNEEGRFTLRLPPGTDSLYLQHLNYGTQAFALADGEAELAAEALEVVLEEVAVTDVPVSEIPARAVARSREALATPVLLRTYYREFVKLHDRYTKFADGLVDYHLEGGRKLKRLVRQVVKRLQVDREDGATPPWLSLVHDLPNKSTK